MPDTSGVPDDSYLRRTVDRETLRFHVQRAIFCPFTHQPLDVRQAVVVTLTSPGGSATTYAIAAAHWDSRKDKVFSRMLAGYTLEVLDGRELFGRRRPSGKPQATQPGKGPSVQPPPMPRTGGPTPQA
jgi:hypothetical protein